MKKLLLTTTFLIAGALGVLAQGKVAFDNNPYSFMNSIENGGTVDYLVRTVAGAPVEDATWTVRLYQGTAPIGDAIPFFGAAFPGVWAAAAEPTFAGVRTLNTGGGVETTLVVKLYDGTGAEIGASLPFAYTPPTSPNPAPSDMLMINFRGFSAVPEPSTIALGVLGLGALLLFRRRS
jgi:hypothetical protein